MKLLKHNTLIVLILAFTFNLKAQDPEFTVIDKSKGLPSNTIYNIYQDKKGFMWFACEAGLTRYDGYEFKTFSNSKQNSKAGTNIKEDNYGRIWYQNFDGYLFYVHNDSLYALKQFKPIGYLSYGIIKNTLFVVSVNGVDVFNLESLEFKKSVDFVSRDFGFTAQDDFNFYVNCDNIFYTIQEKGIISKIPYPPQMAENGYGGTLNNKKNIMIYSGSTGNKINGTFAFLNGSFINQPKPFIANIQNASFSGDLVWLCTNKGVYAFDSLNNPINDGQAFFKDYNISYVFKDREDNYWFSTIGNSLLLVKDIRSKSLLKNKSITQLSICTNKLIVTTPDAELLSYDLQSGEIQNLFKSTSNYNLGTLLYDTIHKNYIVSNNFIEIINNQGKVIFSHAVALKEAQLIDSNYYAMALSGLCGLYKINETKQDKWTTLFRNNYNQSTGFAGFIKGCRAQTVCYNKSKNTIYYGTSYGIQAISPGKIWEIKYKGEAVYCKKLRIHLNKLYGLTNSGRLFYIMPNDSVSFVDIKGDWQFETISDFYMNKNELFIIANDKIGRVNLQKEFFEPKLFENINYEVNDIGFWNGNILIATKNGVILQSTENELAGSTDPLFYIQSIKVNNTYLSNLNELSLPHNKNNIEINYSLLSFKTGGAFPLYYKLNDEEWQFCNPNSRSLKFSSLSPGQYTIRFKLGSPGNSSFKENVVKFEIDRPFWLKSYFILVVLILAVFIIITVIRWRMKELNERNKLLQQKNENEQKYFESALRAIRSQMNPHFFYNALNTIQSFIYNRDNKNASELLSKFSKLTRLVLDMSNKEQITLTEETEALQLYLDIERVRFNKEITFNINTRLIRSPELICLPPMLIQPHVENAFKHGLLHKKGEKKLDILFELKGAVLKVVIDDNGIGRKASAEMNQKKNSRHQSFSTIANLERIEILNRKNLQARLNIIDKYNEHQQPVGTKVEINIEIINLANQKQQFTN